MANDLKAKFEKAAAEAQSLAKRPDDNTLLQLYALYKQATAGDVKGSRPGGLDFVGRAKYAAWAKLKGQTQPAAMESYIALVQKLKEK
jgi:acyl-CoA-binding protein